ncbi:MAG: PAS domain-containing protein, partial [Sphingobacteriales bacterium]
EEQTIESLLEELSKVRQELQMSEDIIDAIRTGSIDALAMQEEGETRIYTLEGAEQTYRVLVENMSEGAITLNHQGLILYSNSQFARLVNLPLHEVMGSLFTRFLHREEKDRFEDMLAEGWGHKTKGEFILQPFAAPNLHVYLSFNILEDKGQELIGMIVTNLSEQKELEKLSRAKEELSAKNTELQKINNDLDTFIYTASHDLKSPVLNIEGLVDALEEILDDGQSKEDMKQITQMIGKSVSRFKSTLLDLTEVSKVQKNFASSEETIDCEEIVQEVMLGLQHLIKQSKAEIVVDMEECSEISFSRKNFHSIVYNLLTNAIKYARQNYPPRIKIKTKRVRDYMLLSVQDNGLGIDMEMETKLFSMFQRLHTHVEGSGIGLYIVKRIMDNAGGAI